MNGINPKKLQKITMTFCCNTVKEYFPLLAAVIVLLGEHKNLKQLID